MKFIYILRDDLAKETMQPFLANNDEQAIFMVKNDVSKSKVLDLRVTLFKIGSLEPFNNGKIDALEPEAIWSSAEPDEDEVSLK